MLHVASTDVNPVLARGIRAWLFRMLASLCFCIGWLHAPTARAEQVLYEEEDLSSPRGATAHFFGAVARNDEAAIAAALGVPATASAAKRTAAASLGRQLATVLSKSALFDLDKVSDDPKGRPEDGLDSERIALLRTRDREVPIVLERVK